MAFLLAAAVLVATSIRGPADVESLTALADAVVHARVVGERSHPAAGGGLIFTEISVLPLEWWKGSQSMQPIAVRVEGGRIGNVGQSVAGAPVLNPGDEVVLFLRRLATGLYEVEHLGMGKFAVKPGAGGLLRAVRDRSQIACAGCETGADDLPFDELRERVRRAA